ncbi:chemotaxis-specific protein-glutamate methyltransferase CheB [Pantanalinema rosaneae CENA516]|uniref:chemotaxis-specific protein-glutamate methyltransferase CheB n=1 Tax=Pantanalinema rosaneae TaxID=1620701 RepID=UPI003D6F5F3B
MGRENNPRYPQNTLFFFVDRHDETIGVGMVSYPIRVLLVEDSPVALTILKRIFASSPEVEVVGTARNGIEALELIPQVNPQVICTDLHMPKMNGLELTQEVMARYPRPILVISTSVQTEDTQTAFQLLEAGALDLFPKPLAGLPSEYEQMKQDLITRIRVLAGVSVFTQHRSRSSAKPAPATSYPDRANHQPAHFPTLASAAPVPIGDIRLPRILAIGASTGGPQVLYNLLSRLPANFPLPILCVQHISEGFLQGLVDWLNSGCALSVTIAQPGILPLPGTVYFAPERVHLEVNHQGRFTLVDTLPVDGHRPSVTVLFKSVATYYRRATIAVLLTGMGRDGAAGMQAIAQMGGVTIAQDEASCIVFGMPREAIALGAAQHILPATDIAPWLLKRLQPA